LQDRFGLAAGRCAAGSLADLLQLRQRAFAIDRGLAVSVERFPGHALRVGDPLLVGFGVAAGRCLGFDDRPLGAGEAVINLGKLSLVLSLNAEMRDPRGTSRQFADREIDAWISIYR
jgi:hypothetical protein